MRIIAEYAHPYFKVTVFHWNQRFLIKVEDGSFEQTYKIHESEITLEEIPEYLNESFYNKVQDIFLLMNDNLP